MTEERIWRIKGDLIKLQYEIDRKSWDVLSLVKHLTALVEIHMGFATHVEVDTKEEEEAFEGELGEECSKKEFYQFIQQNEENLDYICLYNTLNCQDEQGNPIQIPSGLELALYFFDDVYWLDVVVNTDIYAPFYYQKNREVEGLAEMNLPFFKEFIKDIKNTIKGDWTEVYMPFYISDYFEKVGFEIRD